MLFTIHKKEKIYFNAMRAIGIIFWFFLASPFIINIITLFTSPLSLKLAIMKLILVKIMSYSVIFIYFIIFLVFKLCASFWLIGYLRGNAININKEQFPDIFEILKTQATRLHLEKVPALYVLQGGGLLNAFASRFAGKNHVVLYSDVLEVAYKEGRAAVEFIIGHELGHIKRKHVYGLKSLLIAPARLVPFLSRAYSRACEYTCDNIGYSLSPAGAQTGILILAAGKELYKKVNVKALLATNEGGFILWFSEIFSTHPHLINRLASLQELEQKNTVNNFEINPAQSALFKYSSSSQSMQESSNAQELLKSYEDFYGKQKKENQK